MSKICIIDYQAGNLKSLENALSRSGMVATLSNDPSVVLEADLAILPGVGAFGDAMEALKKNGLLEVILNRHKAGKPLIGICLGMQLFFESSDELGYTEGLSLMKGHIRKLAPNEKTFKIPHMGWNTLKGSYSGYVYFVHSFGLTQMDSRCVVSYTNHGQQIPAIVDNLYETGPTKGRLVGFQFHPEKSGPFGELMLKNTIEEVLQS